MASTPPSRTARTGRSPAAARKRRRLLVVVLSLAMLTIAAGLILTAFRDSIVFFYTPSELAEKPVPAGRALRIGGLVEPGSIAREGDTVRFRVTDLKAVLPVTYRGVLPDLFRECQGVVAEGALGADGIFQARQVLAKHDENYMPPEIAHVAKPDACQSTAGAVSGPAPPGATR